jgi:uncharacterized membrane protein
MFEFAAFTYGVLASFVLASIRNNKRSERSNPRILTMFGWCLMAFSLTLSLLLTGFLAYRTIGGETLL